jgi:AcrR family transcriptional regulator
MASRTKSSARRSAARKSPAKRKTKGGGVRASQKAAIRGRIVKAALDLFQSKGFDATTTRMIAKRAKLAEGTIFNYFETKEDLALYFFELEVDHAIAAVRDNPKLGKAPLEEKLFALVEAQLDYLAPYEKFIGAAFVHALRPTSRLSISIQALDLRNRYLAFVQQLIEESPASRPGSVIAFAVPMIFWIYYIGILLHWLNDTSPGKGNTLALLDRTLSLGVGFLRQGSF